MQIWQDSLLYHFPLVGGGQAFQRGLSDTALMYVICLAIIRYKCVVHTVITNYRLVLGSADL